MTRRTTLVALLPLLALASFASLAASRPVTHAVPANTPIRGDYVEVRTASVFAGACHYNGERVTEGKSAILAWKIDAGTIDGVDLAGVKLVAIVNASGNLADESAVRTTELIIDADPRATAAATAWVKTRSELGSVRTVRESPIAFTRDGGSYAVCVERVASLSVRPMPDAGCCSQPHLVWYQPLTSGLENRRVGFTMSARVEGTDTEPRWERTEENSAFYGAFGD